MKILGIHAGVGSMIIPAKELRLNIVGNIEPRRIFHYGEPFQRYFNAPMYKNFDDVFAFQNQDIHIVIGHPECGDFSNLKIKKSNTYTVNDIRQWMKMTQIINPLYFVMDNLPGAMDKITAKEWNKMFPDYDIFFEYISNYDYGNVQRNRNRLFVIGAKRFLKFTFIPGGNLNNLTTKEVISGLTEKDKNHVFLKPDDDIRGWSTYNIPLPKFRNIISRRIKFKEFQKYLNSIPSSEYNKKLWYINKKNEKKKRPILLVTLDKPSYLLTGSSGFDNIWIAVENRPFTIREKLRIQGAPDDFVLYPTEYDSGGIVRMKHNIQVGKFMPVQACRYILNQIMINWYKDSPIEEKKQTELEKNYFRRTIFSSSINKAKREYCNITNYTDQDKACKFCWLKKGCVIKLH